LRAQAGRSHRCRRAVCGVADADCARRPGDRIVADGRFAAAGAIAPLPMDGLRRRGGLEQMRRRHSFICTLIIHLRTALPADFSLQIHAASIVLCRGAAGMGQLA
jgi:hypothetical protein